MTKIKSQKQKILVLPNTRSNKIRPLNNKNTMITRKHFVGMPRHKNKLKNKKVTIIHLSKQIYSMDLTTMTLILLRQLMIRNSDINSHHNSNKIRISCLVMDQVSLRNQLHRNNLILKSLSMETFSMIARLRNHLKHNQVSPNNKMIYSDLVQMVSISQTSRKRKNNRHPNNNNNQLKFLIRAVVRQ